MRIAMTAITTSSSISVNPVRFLRTGSSFGSMVGVELAAVEQCPEDVGQRLRRVAVRTSLLDVLHQRAGLGVRWRAGEGREGKRLHLPLRVEERGVGDGS